MGRTRCSSIGSRLCDASRAAAATGFLMPVPQQTDCFLDTTLAIDPEKDSAATKITLFRHHFGY